MKETLFLLRGTIFLIVLLFLGACSHPLDEPWLDKNSPKPHSTSRLNCKMCHDLTIECNECHFGASGSISSSDWTHGTTPHDQLEADGEVCNTCHNLNRGYGNGPPTCHDCHGLPGFHVIGEDWSNKKSPDFHGTSTLNCADCHDLGTECVECHFGASGNMSPSDWTHGTDPHDQLEVDGPVCNACHDLNRGYGNGPDACHDCHGLPADHVRGEAWLNKTSPDFHGGISILNCADCHDLSLKCGECHFGTSGNKTPSNWVHGTTPHDQLEADGEVCKTCHDLNRGYGNGPDACHDCHGLPANHVRGEAWLNKTSPAFHGGSPLNCADCHNLSLKCNECHFGTSGSMSPPDWTHGTDPHDQLEADGAVCKTCHDLNRGYGNGPESCHDCHGPPANHVRGEPWLNKTSPDFHGGSTLNCADCHDLSLKCNECHFGTSGSMSPPDWTHGTDPHDQLEADGPVCNTCHELNRGYGNGPESCHDCHDLNIHAVPFSGHELQAISDPASCQECHGADLNGGSGPACSECHTADSPLTALNCTSCHDKPPTGTGAVYPNTNGAHTVHNLLAGVTGFCDTCHQGAGTQTAEHYDTVVDVAFSGYNASSGTAYYDSGIDTCSKVSCHGGKNTRKWFSESIDVDTECDACHSLEGEYNSYVSGKHKKHVQDKGHPCTECHDVVKLQPVHFNDLGTPQMNQAEQTILDELHYNGQYCLFTCHFQNGDKKHDEGKKW